MESPLPDVPPIGAAEAAPTLRQDVGTAFRNAFALGTSLIATWGVALVVRLFLPRFLGPERFGLYSFADSLAAAMLGLLSFGVDPYVQKEIPVRPEHASDFIGGVILFRSLLAAVAIATIVVVLRATGRPREALVVFIVLGVGWTLFNVNQSLAALLQANTTVGGLAVVNPTTKILWGVAIGLGMAFNVSLPLLAAAYALSEGTRVALLSNLVRRQMHVRWHVDLRATWAVLVVSLPYYVNALALAVNARLDVAVLGFVIGDDATVGLFGAAANLAGLALMMVPLMFAVLMPLMSRSFQRSEDEFWSVVRRAIEGLQMVAMPVTLFLVLGSDLWVTLLFGKEYAASGVALACLAPQFVFTYVAMLLSMSLIVLGRAWTLTRISVAAVILHPILAVALIHLGHRVWGPSGALMGAALGATGTEVAAAGMLFASLGTATFDRANTQVLLRTVLACALVAGLFVGLAHWGHVRLAVCAGAYVILAFGLRAVRPQHLMILIRQVRQARA
jgi:O-antigen/teichoic acid export membrane protein